MPADLILYLYFTSTSVGMPSGRYHKWRDTLVPGPNFARDMDDMRWRAGRGEGVFSADCEVSHINLAHISNSEGEIGGRCADTMQ